MISLHGTTADAHETFSGVEGVFSETLENIRRTIDADISVSISTILTAYNSNQIENMVDLVNELGATQVVFNRYIGCSLEGIELEPSLLRVAVQQIEDLRKSGAKVRYGPCIPSCFVASSASGCQAGTSFLAIDPYGNVKPCTHAPIIAGNLLNQNWRSIWNSNEMLFWDSLVPKACQKCAEFHVCHGGCRASALLLQKEQDPLIAPSKQNQLPVHVLG